MTPRESVVYWTEYVLRHNGAHHLKSEALNLTWYQYMLLDVLFFVAVSFLAATYSAYKISRFFYSRTVTYFKSAKCKQE